MNRLIVLLKCLVVSSLLAAAAVADDFQRIIDDGVVRIGVPLDVPVYGFADENQKPAGLDIDIATLVAKALGVKLELQQITGINRIPFLLTNKVTSQALGAFLENYR